MIVQCQNCETRFHVADARIPAKGARVRCSRCHHRFHITPSSAPPAQPSTPGKASAAASGPGREPAREEDELDNPEFLFDKPEAAESTPPRARQPGPDAAETQLHDPHLAEPPDPETPPPPAEERVVESGGKTAQEMLDAGAPQLPNSRFELGGSLGERETESASSGDDDDNTQGSTFLTGNAAQPNASPQPELEEASAPALADVEALAADLGEDEDSSFADWDPLASPAAPAEGAPIPSLFAAPPAATAARALPGASASVFDQPDLPAAPAAKRRAAPEIPVSDPEAAGPTALILHIAAVLVGLALIGAAGRLLWLQRDDVPPAPEIVQAGGWIAADLETFLARDATGERVLIVRGNLFPEGSAPPPQVAVRLLGADGEALAESHSLWLNRIDDAEVAPERLGLQQAAAGGDIAALGQLVTGFTAVLADPPAGVRRVEVLLSARTSPPAGTATAVAPPEPGELPNSETASPSSSELPGAPQDADVVPAAPEPE